MDFEWGEEEQAFRRELQEFLAAELPPYWEGKYNMDVRQFEATMKVAGKMAEAGWLTMHWPKEYGGQEAPIWKQVVMREEMIAHHEPRGQQYMSSNWVGPSIMLFGTDEQKQLHLNQISEGRSLWAQGFSEPDAGSDLASLRTRAVRDGDEYVINGEKIWTSHTPHAEWIFVLTRTDPDAPKHKGISVFLLPINTPGIEVVPIKSMIGYGEFAHVYFKDCRVPASTRLGPENEGWKVTVAALNFERMGQPRFWTSISRLDQLASEAKRLGLWDDPRIRDRFAQLRVRAEAARLMFYRVVSLIARGQDITFFGSMQRIYGTESNAEVESFALELGGELGEIEDRDGGYPFDGKAGEWWRHSIPATIVAGTAEINRNVVAHRGLGLPR